MVRTTAVSPEPIAASVGIHNDLGTVKGIYGMGVEDRHPIAAGILRHAEIADHLHFEGLALLSSWRLECEVSNIIYRGGHEVDFAFGENEF
jgi:hypothetical protein